MTVRPPGALLLSTTLHAGIGAIVLLLVYAAQTQVKVAPPDLIMVQHDSDFHDRTEAQPDRTKGGIQFAIPKPTLPAAQAAVRLAAAPLNESPRSSIGAKAVKPASTKITEAQFAAQNKPTKTATTAPLAVKHIDTESIVQEAQTGAATQETLNANATAAHDPSNPVTAYLAVVRQALQDGLEKPAGLGDAIFAAVNFRLSPDGTISGARIVRASGSEEFDRAVMADLRNFQRIRPPAQWKGEIITMTFRMKPRHGT